MAQIQANRESIDDRFSVLGFTIRSDDPFFEIGLAAHPDLLRADHVAQRTSRNFYSSRVLRATHARRGESIYLVPPDVLAQFVGMPRLYFGMATYKEGDRAHPASVKVPDAGSMYVSIAGLTERGLRRIARSTRGETYGNGGESRTWGGDAVASTPAATPAARSGNGGTGAAPISPAPAPYSDGYPDDLWKQAGTSPPPATGTRPGTANAPATAAPEVATAPVRALAAASTTQDLRRRPTSPPFAKPFLVEPYDRSSDWWDALLVQIGHFARGAMWFLGVTDTTKPPYSAICQVRRVDGSSDGARHGTAFYIAPRLLLTAAHVVDGQSELIIVPGKNGGGSSGSSEPFGRFRATQFRQHPDYGKNGSDNDMALICVPAANAVAAPNYFDLVEELTQSRPEGVVVSGYAAWWYATSGIEEFVNANIDADRQHAHGGYIRELPTDGTFAYDLQTLGGTSGSPVYWIEDSAQPRAHMVGVHVAAHNNQTNLGCRITQEKLRWIRDTAAAWGQTLTFSLGARALDASPAVDLDDPEIFGITGGEPVPDAATAASLAYRSRALDAPTSDYPGANRFVTAHAHNFTVGRRRDVPVDRIVIHITAGGPSINGTIAWFQNGNRVNEKTGKPIRSSAHYIVGRDGEVVQMVRNADTAHHASQINWRSIGIEHNANKPYAGNRLDLPPTDPQYEASARLVAWLCQQHGLPIDREHIVGHMEASPRDNHDCPSSIWDWDHYMACVQAAAGATAIAQGLSLPPARRRVALALEDAAAGDRFVWPAGAAQANHFVSRFIDTFNARSDNEDSKRQALRDVEAIAEALKTDSGRDDVGRAILLMTTAVALQAFDLIKDRLPRTFYALISVDVNNPPPAPSETFTMPRALPLISQRLGTFMAWVDAAIQQASADTAERIAFQRDQWGAMRGMVGAGFTMVGLVPGLGTAATFIGLALDAVLNAAAPDFDAQFTSFEAAMQAIRRRYKDLAAAALRGLIQAKLEPGRDTPIVLDLPLHEDVQAYLDAHSAHALRGWQNELAFLGVGTPATALALQRVPLSRAQEIITPFYDPADPATALTCQADAFSLAREEWFAGVPNTTIFPHSAICLLEMTDASGSLARGTGFYIGRNRILTCAHNLYGQASVDIVPGKNGQGPGTEPFGRCTVQASSWRIPASYGGSNAAFDLAVIDNVPLEAPNGAWFPVLEELKESRPEGVIVCGYSSRSNRVPELTAAIDGFKQHLHAGYIAALGPGDSTFDYPILSLKRASGSPVYVISDRDSALQAYVVGVHIGSATEDLNRGCRLTQAKIDWIEGRTTSLSIPQRGGRRYAARGLEEATDDDSTRGIEGPIPDDVATAQSPVARARALDAPRPEYPQAARFVPAATGNYRASASARTIERVVIHITDGGANINGTIGWFQNPAAKVSAHYVIGQDGEVVQMVLHNDVAWHARSANRTSIGIEHVANTRGLNPTPAQMCASAALVTWLCDTYGVAADRAHIVGHSEADPSTTHTGCPNAVWNWDYYMRLVDTRTCFPPDAATTQDFRGSRALGNGTLDYAVALIPQPDKNACWAASMAMLLSFRRNASFSPEALANEVGTSLATSYSWELLDAVRARYGFTMIAQPSNTSLYHSPQQWADWLGQYGPLWVVIVGAPHAVLVAGIRGDLANPASVQVKILNPWDTRVAFDTDPVAFNPPNAGYEDWLAFTQFAADFGNMAQPDYGNWRVLHLPVAAASAHSLGAARRRLAPAPAPVRILGADASVPAETREAIEPTRVPGTRMSVMRGTSGASRWALDQLEGFSEPAVDGQTVMQSETADVTIDLGAWPAIEGEPSPLPLTVVFRGTRRGAVGDVQIRAGAAPAAAYGVEVVARIDDDGDIGNVSSLKVGIDYRFVGLAQGAPAARIDLRLLGDGRYERINRWVSAALAA